MYTMSIGASGNIYICDPDGVVICILHDEMDAEELLSHLNRGN